MILYDYVNAIGQDSHGFVPVGKDGKPPDPKDNQQLILGGYVIPDGRPLKANSDGDVLLHALTNAVSGVTCVNILGAEADRMCLENGIRNSRQYLLLALQYLKGRQITHVSFSIECKSPKLAPHIENIRMSVADILGIAPSSIGITATSGEGLSAFGKGEGIMVFCSITVRHSYGSFAGGQQQADLPEL